MSCEPLAADGRLPGMHQTIAWPPPALPAALQGTAAATEVVVASAPSFEDFFEQNYERTVRVAYLMLGQRSVAEDVVQDSFARVELRWAKLDAPNAYLYRALVTRTRDVQRCLLVRRRHLPADPPPPSRDELAEALAKLPIKRRAAVVLRYYDGLDEAEIADILGVRPRTVNSMLHRATAQLREVVER